MRSLPDDDRPAVGLRERKKARTKASIQEQALRLFREQGYAATTVEQIAAAAEISPSTFFRYFPTKEDVVLQDEYDPMIVEAFKAQPAELSPIAALRGAVHAGFAQMSAEEVALSRERLELVRSVPEVRARMLDEFARNVQMIAEVVAERVGRRPDELAMRTFAGALVGAVQAALMAWAEDPDADYMALIDAAMAHVEAGVPL
jgi:AcrR family transcriptional regulator